MFPTVGGVEPSLTIHAIDLRTVDRIEELAARGELAPQAVSVTSRNAGGSFSRHAPTLRRFR